MSVLPVTIEGVAWRPGGRAVLDGLDATLAAPGVTAVVGPNGAGKSTLLRVLDGLVRAESGLVRFGGRPPETVRRAFVFQEPALVRASVAANVALALAPLRLARANRAGRVERALARVGLLDRAGEPARRLSGGERQRLALARAWATEPELLLLDEPTASLDPTSTEAVEALIAVLASSGTKIILVSHNLGQVARLAADVLVLDKGRAVEHGPSERILAAPRTPQARAYLRGELPWTAFAAAS